MRTCCALQDHRPDTTVRCEASLSNGIIGYFVRRRSPDPARFPTVCLNCLDTVCAETSGRLEERVGDAAPISALVACHRNGSRTVNVLPLPGWLSTSIVPS